MQFTIIGGKGRKNEVVAEETKVPGLLITHEIGWAEHYKLPKWHVTHQGTTQKLTGEPVPKRHAQLIAGALGGLPINWAMTTQEEIYKAAKAIEDTKLRSWLTRELRS